MNLKLFLGTVILAINGFAQKNNSAITNKSPFDSTLFSKTSFRSIGPFRGGRSAAVCGDFKNKQVFYFGATGGGVWKTNDGGSNWKNISDKYFGGSIGAVAVAPSDQNILYVGEGEHSLRGNVSEGLNGMWKSEDGGRTWKNLGLKNSRHISRIIIHPKDPNIVLISVIGHLFGSSEDRGVYKTTDGGKTWRKTLFSTKDAGAVDLVVDPSSFNTIYASTWKVRRTPYSLESGGEGSAIWKSTDAGETWKNISKNKGLPKDTIGISGLTVCTSNPDRLYAIIESKTGGVFKSEDAGNTWEKINESNDLRQRSWYYSKIFADPKNADVLYICNVGFWRSKDAGKTFTQINTPHGDHHDFWIDPEDGNRVILGDDGGASVSYDAGSNWSSINNQATAQFYRVSTDNHFPYRVLGAQQDNSSVRILSRTYGDKIGIEDWQPSAGAESGYIVADPNDDNIVYGGNYGGYLSRLNHQTGENRAVSVWPDNPMGAGADAQKYRFQWNFPILFSPHNSKKIYAAGNVLFSSEDEGQSWKALSGDLTKNDKSKQASSGGAITKDNTGVEYYCTIFTFMESLLEKDVLWTGSDDGLLHISKDGGNNWTNVTPKGMPEWMMFNCIEQDPFDKGTVYVVGTKYKSDDFTPYIYKTTDYGNTWSLITKGINNQHFARVVRADHNRSGLLYAGTEYGLYVSIDGGSNWYPFQKNLPIVPITDMTIKNKDLIIATQGRSFYILDDLSLLQQYDDKILNNTMRLFKPEASYRMEGVASDKIKNAGMNPPNGVVVNFYIKDLKDSTKVELRFLDLDNKIIKTLSNKNEKENKLIVFKGMNIAVWDMKYKEVEKLEGMILWNGNPGNIKVAPGNYKARLVIEKDSTEQLFTILGDPNYKMSDADYKEQVDFLTKVKDKFVEVQSTIKDLRDVRSQITNLKTRLGKDIPKELTDLAKEIDKKSTAVEEALYQTKAKAFQDVINYPIKLNDKLAGVFDAANSGYAKPSKQVKEAFTDIGGKCDIEIEKWKGIKSIEIKNFNKLIREKEINLIQVK
jgi:photosystem II stability/assembly factor-like uncharacterized protein